MAVEPINQDGALGGALLQDHAAVITPGRALAPVAAVGAGNLGQRARAHRIDFEDTQHAVVVGIGFGGGRAIRQHHQRIFGVRR